MTREHHSFPALLAEASRDFTSLSLRYLIHYRSRCPISRAELFVEPTRYRGTISRWTCDSECWRSWDKDPLNFLIAYGRARYDLNSPFCQRLHWKGSTQISLAVGIVDTEPQMDECGNIPRRKIPFCSGCLGTWFCVRPEELDAKFLRKHLVSALANLGHSQMVDSGWSTALENWLLSCRIEPRHRYFVGKLSRSRKQSSSEYTSNPFLSLVSMMIAPASWLTLYLPSETLPKIFPFDLW